MSALKLRRRIELDRDDALQVAEEVSTRAGLDADASEDLELALARFDTCNHRLQALPEVKVVSEPDVYVANGEHSFFRDMTASAGGPFPVPGVRPQEAQARLQRHQRYEMRRLEVKDDLAKRRLDALGIESRSVRDDLGGQSRALSSAAGAGGEVVPPAWIVEQWASGVRAASPLARLVTRVDLPRDTLELHIPRFDSSAGVVPTRQVENTSLQDIEGSTGTTDALVAKVATFAGDVLLSQQMHDRGGTFNDQVMLGEFTEAYAAGLQYQLINGTGTNGQLLGLLNVSTSAVSATIPGAIVQTYTAASPTQAGVIQAIAQVAANVADARERAPEFCLIRGSRYFWLAGSAGGSGDPGQRIGQGYLYAAKAPEDGPWGPIAGLPAYLDATIPSNLGAGTNQDCAIVCRGRDILLLEDPAGPRFSAYVSGGLAGEMSVVLQWHTYTAAFTNRYPSSIGTVTGTGFVVPSGF